MPCCRRVFTEILYLIINSLSVVYKIKKNLYRVYGIDNPVLVTKKSKICFYC